MNNSRWKNVRFSETGYHVAVCSVCDRVQQFRDTVVLELDCPKKCEAEWARRQELSAREEARSMAKTGLLF